MIRFVFLYAWRDLTDPASARSTAVALGTLVAAIAASLGGFGFTFGVEQVSRKRLEKDPFARTLWTGGWQVSGMITPQVVDDLRKATPPGTRVYPFRNVSIEFSRKSGRALPSLTGRTISLDVGAEDDLFSSRPVRRPGQSVISAPTDRGLVATPQLLLALGYDPDDPPQSLTGSYDWGGGRSDPQPIPILGVTVEDLPLFHQFVVTDDYLQELGTTLGSKQGYNSIITTRLPVEWQSFHKQLPERARAAAERQSEAGTKLTIGDDTYRKAKVWRFELPANIKLSVKRWQEILDAVDRELQEIRPVPGQRLKVDTTGYPTYAPPPRSDFDMIAVVVPTLDGLVGAADAVAAVSTPGGSLPVNRDVVEKVVRLNEQTRLMVQTVTVMEAFLIAIVAWNLFVVQAMRADRQIAEVGMLKAMGMARSGVVAAYLVEAILLWLPAAAIGTAIGLATAYGSACWRYRGDPEAIRNGFYWSWQLIGLVLGGSAALTLGCAGLATARTALASPSETLRDGR